MKSKLAVGLSIATGRVVLVLIGFLVAAFWHQPLSNVPQTPPQTTPPGTIVERKDLSDPKLVANPDWVRQTIRLGKACKDNANGLL